MKHNVKFMYCISKLRWNYKISLLNHNANTYILLRYEKSLCVFEIYGVLNHYPKVWHPDVWENSRNGEITLTHLNLEMVLKTQEGLFVLSLKQGIRHSVECACLLPGEKKILFSEDARSQRRIWANKTCYVSSSLLLSDHSALSIIIFHNSFQRDRFLVVNLNDLS